MPYMSFFGGGWTRVPPGTATLEVTGWTLCLKIEHKELINSHIRFYYYI
jgi:hypothetical protein